MMPNEVGPDRGRVLDCLHATKTLCVENFATTVCFCIKN